MLGWECPKVPACSVPSLSTLVPLLHEGTKGPNRPGGLVYIIIAVMQVVTKVILPLYLELWKSLFKLEFKSLLFLLLSSKLQDSTISWLQKPWFTIWKEIHWHATAKFCRMGRSDKLKGTLVHCLAI